jgi:uncharacterized protein
MSNKQILELFKQSGDGESVEAEIIKAMNSPDFDPHSIPYYNETDESVDNTDGRGFLHRAVQYGLHGVVEALIKKGVNVNALDPVNNATPLHYLVSPQNQVQVSLKTLRYLIDRGANINAMDYRRRTPIVALLEDTKRDKGDELKSKEDLAVFLIEQGARLDGVYGALAISAAIYSPRVFDLLASKGVDINGGEYKGVPRQLSMPLLTAMLNKDQKSCLATIMRLLDSGVSSKSRAAELCLCASTQQLYCEDIHELLLAKGVNQEVLVQLSAAKSVSVNIVGKDKNFSEAVKLLQQGNIDISLPLNEDGATLLHVAATAGATAVAAELIKQGADVNALTFLSESPLHELCDARDSSVAVATLLLDANANIEERNYRGNTPIMNLLIMDIHSEASRQSHVDLLQLLLDRGARIDEGIGFKVFDRVAFSSEAAKMLIAKGIDPNGDVNSVPANRAASEGNADLYFYLLEKGLNIKPIAGSVVACALSETNRHEERQRIAEHAIQFIDDVDADMNGYGGRLLHYCAMSSQEVIAQLLIERGAKVNVVNANNETPLQASIRFGAFTVAKILITAGASLEGAQGAACLNSVIRRQRFAGVELLLNQSVNPNTPFNNTTPLQLAVETVQPRVAEKLLQAGANPNAKEDALDYPLAIAISKKNEELVHLLLTNGADVTLKPDKAASMLKLAEKAKNEKIISLLGMSMDELKQHPVPGKALRFENKLEFTKKDKSKCSAKIRKQMSAADLDIEPDDLIEYFDIVDAATGEGRYNIMLYPYGSGSLFEWQSATLVGYFAQHGFDFADEFDGDEQQLRSLLQNAYSSFEGKIGEIVSFV